MNRARNKATDYPRIAVDIDRHSRICRASYIMWMNRDYALWLYWLHGRREHVISPLRESDSVMLSAPYRAMRIK
jgi:hypothetical protein